MPAFAPPDPPFPGRAAADAVAGPTQTELVPPPQPRGPADPAGPGAGLQAVVLFWAAVGLAMAWVLGAFGRRSIVGPERMAHDESAWGLLVAAGAGVVAAIEAGPLVAGLLRGRLPADLLLLVTLAGADGAGFLTLYAVARVVRGPVAVRRLGLGVRHVPFGVGGGLLTMVILFPLVAVTGMAITWLFHRLGRPDAEHAVLQMLGQNHGRSRVVVAVVAVVVVGPMAEELLFRGLLQTMLGRLFGWLGATLRAARTPRPADTLTRVAALPQAGPVAVPAYEPRPWARSPRAHAPPVGPRSRWAAVLVTAALFAMVHGEAEFLPPLVVLAVGLGYVYERSGNLWMTIVAHGLFNAVQLGLFLHGG